MTDSAEPIAFTVPPVVKQVTIAKPAAEAFRLFTADIAKWWPLKGYSVGREMAAFCAIEPHVGGRVFERSGEGTECDWGTVLVWDPPHAFACSWHPSRPADMAQRVELRFIGEAPSVTRVELVHSGWESTPEVQKMRDGYDGGWIHVLESYANLART